MNHSSWGLPARIAPITHRGARVRRACAGALIALLALAAPWTTSAAGNMQPGADMQSRVAAVEPGALLSIKPQQPAPALIHAARRYLVTYRSRGVHGEAIVASGTVLVPRSTPPHGGWPVLAWAHGTTGVAAICAPSGTYPGGPEWDYQELVDQALDPWLAQGYVVVAPDYEGLGTPGGHPYMNAASQLHTVDDAVRAAHRLLPGALRPDWLVMGHSQGGAAALMVAAHGQADVPELKLRGAIAVAPGGYRYAGIAEYALAHPRLDPGVAAFFPIVLLGAATADPAIHLDALLSRDMQPLLNAARSRCLDGLRDLIRKPPGHVFKPGADLRPLLTYLAAQSIENMTPTVPVEFIQGEADQLVDATGVRAYHEQLCQAGKTAFFQAIPHGSHREALRQSFKLSRGFVAGLDGQQQPEPCSAVPQASRRRHSR